MRWDAVILGRLVIPARQHKAWLAAELDWKSVEGSAALKGYISGETVGEIIVDVSFDEPTEFLTLTWNGDELQLRSYQSRAGFGESMVGFAAAWAAAAGFEGHGELIGLGVGSRFAYRITVEPGQASVVRVDDDQVDALADRPDAVALREAILGKGGAMAEKLSAALSRPLSAPPPRPNPADVASASKKKSAGKKKSASAKKPAASKA